ncbi:unnamed protein product [Laminaria digitata]
MWASGNADSVNVNERVIVAAADVESGNWTVQVSAGPLTTELQSYSLVVNGAIVPSGESTTGGSQASSSSSPLLVFLLLVAGSLSSRYARELF